MLTRFAEHGLKHTQLSAGFGHLQTIIM